MSDLVEFLRARLDELEVDVTESRALAPGDLHWSMPDWLDRNYLLADIAAKRRIVELHAGEHGCREFVSGTYPADAHLMNETPGARWEHAMSEYFEDRSCTTLLLLAAPFSTHPDYDPDWAVPMS